MDVPGSSDNTAEDAPVLNSVESKASQATSASTVADCESSSVHDSVARNEIGAISTRIKVKVQIMGSMHHLGPAPSQIVGSLDALDRWTASIKKNYKFNEGAAHQLNDAFIKRLLTLTERDLDGVSAISRQLEFKRIQNNGRYGSFLRRERMSRPTRRSEDKVSDLEDQASNSDSDDKARLRERLNLESLVQTLDEVHIKLC
ncbi:hypothetical protein EG329_003310 [Mollisiaceae sp. DMI_Dod_QoI]|nr:hypothetical protein EG329_003310 [Helotiales sp. DMI_Dod_QoI]